MRGRGGGVGGRAAEEDNEREKQTKKNEWMNE